MSIFGIFFYFCISILLALGALVVLYGPDYVIAIFTISKTTNDDINTTIINDQDETSVETSSFWFWFKIVGYFVILVVVVSIFIYLKTNKDIEDWMHKYDYIMIDNITPEQQKKNTIRLKNTIKENGWDLEYVVPLFNKNGIEYHLSKYSEKDLRNYIENWLNWLKVTNNKINTEEITGDMLRQLNQRIIIHNIDLENVDLKDIRVEDGANIYVTKDFF